MQYDAVNLAIGVFRQKNHHYHTAKHNIARHNGSDLMVVSAQPAGVIQFADASTASVSNGAVDQPRNVVDAQIVAQSPFQLLMKRAAVGQYFSSGSGLNSSRDGSTGCVT